MKLYEYTEQFLIAASEMSDMDLPDNVIQDTLDGLLGDIEGKGKNIGAFIQNMEGDITLLKSHEKQVKDKRLRLEKRINWMKDYLLNNMQRVGITEISCALYTIKPQKNPPAVWLTNEEIIPDKYKTEVTAIKINKSEIAKDLKEGIIVDGAELHQGWRLSIK